MARLLLLLTVFASQLHAPAYGSPQNDRPLNLSTIEQLLKIEAGDEVIAGQIRKVGIDFRVDAATLDRLGKLGAGERTKQALRQHEERAAYTEFSNEKNPATRLTLGRAFLQKYPLNAAAPKVKAELRKVEFEVFEAAFRTYSDNPTLSGLNQVLTLGNRLLGRYADRAMVVQVTPKMAIAAHKGMIGNFYNDLEHSRGYANQALMHLEDPAPPPEMDRQTYSQLRTRSLSMIYQSLGLTLMRQPVPDADQAISYLTKAAELKDGPAANDPITYWLRALARAMNFQKLSDEYRALPKAERVGRRGQSLCGRITEIVNQQVSDYTQVLSLSGGNDSAQLKDEAVAALNLLVTGERPCIGGRSGLIDELPDEEKRFALVIGAEDYLDKQVGKFNYAASDARAAADALIRHGGFRKENIVLLATGEPIERQPLRSVILQQLSALPNRVKLDGLLLVYFVGHGFEKAGKTYLLAADSLTGNEALLSDTAISGERFKALIQASGAGQVMLIFDSFRQTPASESFSRLLSFDLRKNEVTAFATLLSASAGQRGYGSQTKKQGFFTSVFLEAIKGKAANKNRVVTLENLAKYLRTAVPQEAQRELGATAQQSPLAVIEGYEAEDLEMFSSGQPGADAVNANLAELVRSAQTIHIRSKTVYLNAALLEAELSKLPEFQALKLKIVSEAKEADLVVEVTLPFLTWMWNFTITHRTGNTLVASGKLRELTAVTASPKLAKELATRLQALREPTSPQR
ncbi:MAG: caspase family protein [Acidobacteriota bacterium]